MFLISINNIISLLASFDIWNCYDPLYNMDDLQWPMEKYLSFSKMEYSR
jgi:hypothetical protein